MAQEAVMAQEAGAWLSYGSGSRSMAQLWLRKQEHWLRKQEHGLVMAQEAGAWLSFGSGSRNMAQLWFRKQEHGSVMAQEAGTWLSYFSIKAWYPIIENICVYQAKYPKKIK